MGFVAPLFFILFFSCLPAKEAKKPKRRNVETAVAAVIWRAVERYPPPQIKETKKKVNDLLLLLLRLGSRCVATTKTLGMPTAEERL
jgi:hypothetical protein